MEDGGRDVEERAQRHWKFRKSRRYKLRDLQLEAALIANNIGEYDD